MHFVGFKLHRGSNWLSSQRKVAGRKEDEDEGSVRETKAASLDRGRALAAPTGVTVPYSSIHLSLSGADLQMQQEGLERNVVNEC